MGTSDSVTRFVREADEGKARDVFLDVIFLKISDMQHYIKVNEDMKKSHNEDGKLPQDPDGRICNPTKLSNSKKVGPDVWQLGCHLRTGRYRYRHKQSKIIQL